VSNQSDGSDYARLLFVGAVEAAGEICGIGEYQRAARTSSIRRNWRPDGWGDEIGSGLNNMETARHAINSKLQLFAGQKG